MPTRPVCTMLARPGLCSPRGPLSCRAQPVWAAGSRPTVRGSPSAEPRRLHGNDGTTSRGGGTRRPTALEEAAWRGVALTSDVSSAATRAMAVEHGGPTATPAAWAPTTAEEETTVLSSNAESGGDLRGRRRRRRAGTGRGGRRWRAADAYPWERQQWRAASDTAATRAKHWTVAASVMKLLEVEKNSKKIRGRRKSNVEHFS
jgi:hypothetical protein